MADYFPCVSLLGTDQLRYNMINSRSVFNLAGSQKLSIIIYGPQVLHVSIFNMGVLIGVKAYRQPPSDILLFSNIFSILKIFVIYLTMSTCFTNQYMTMFIQWTPFRATTTAFALGQGSSTSSQKTQRDCIRQSFVFTT